MDGIAFTFFTTGRIHGFALSSRYAPIPYKYHSYQQMVMIAPKTCGLQGVTPPSRSYPCSGRPCMLSSDRRGDPRGPEEPPRRGSSLLILWTTCGLRYFVTWKRRRRMKKRKRRRGRKESYSEGNPRDGAIAAT